MKYLLALILFGFLFTSPLFAADEYRSRPDGGELHPEKNNPNFGLKGPSFSRDKTLVCFPSVDPSYRSTNFQIKPSTGTCGKDEKIFELKRGEGQSVLFLPYESPNSQPAGGIPGNPSTGKQILYDR